MEWLPFAHRTGRRILWLDWCSKHSKLFIAECRAVWFGSDYASCFPHVLKEILEGLLACHLLGLTCSTAKWGSLLFLNCGPLVNYHFPMRNSFFYFNVLQMWEVCLYGYSHYVLFFIYATLLFCSATGVSIELAWLHWTSWHRWLAACKLLEEAGSQQGWLHSQEYGICSGSRKILGFQIRFVTVRIISWRKLISGQKLLNQSTCP